MNKTNAIEVKNVSKKYSLIKGRPILMKNLLLRQKKEEKWALKNVSLTIKKGETVGIIGENGSGKSTLLKIISGITTPTRGDVKVTGRVVSLIELGAGFHQDLTGKENVYLNGMLLGFSKKELDKKYKEIVDFANIGQYINQPVRTYSSGMIVRLGFSVAIHSDPDILVVDEVLAVGDEEFQRKCFDKLRMYRQNNCTIVLVSHNLHAIKNLCDKTVWIHKGEIKHYSSSQNSIKKYLQRLNDAGKMEGISFFRHKTKKEIYVNKVRLVNNEVTRNTFHTGDSVTLSVSIISKKISEKIVCGFIVRDEMSNIIFGTNTELDDFNIATTPSKRLISYTIPYLPLAPGTYFLDISLRGKYEVDIYDDAQSIVKIIVKQTVRLGLGNIDLKGVWSESNKRERRGMYYKEHDSKNL